MEERLRKIQAMDKAYVVQETTDEIDSIVGYFEQHPAKELLPLSYYYAGRIYSDLEDAPQAVDFFQKALDCEPEDSLKALIHSQLGTLFLRQRMVDASMEHVKAAYSYDVQNADTTGMIFDLRDLGNAYRYGEEDVDSSLTYYLEALRLASKQNDTLMQEELEGSIAAYYIQKDSLQTAWRWLQPLLRGMDERDAISASSLRSMAAEYYMKKGDADSAQVYFLQLAESGTLMARQEAYKQLAEMSLKRGDMSRSMVWMKAYETCTDSIAEVMQAEAVAQTDALYNYRLRERENEKLTKAMMKTKTIAAGAVGLLLVGGLFTLFLYYRNKHKRAVLQLRTEHLEQLQEQERKRSKAYMEENEQKIKELKEEMRKTNQENWQLQEKMEKLRYANELASIEISERRQAEQMVLNSNIYQRINKRLQDSKDYKMSEAEWYELENVIELAYKDFKKSIGNVCQLKKQDLRVCLLLKAGFSPINIALLTAHSRQSISSTRRRLYERTFMEKGTPSQWDDFIKTI
jgi:tetratricopeptide (TPR) repeat protein